MAGRSRNKTHHPVRVIDGDNRYLLQVADGLFYFRTAGDGKPFGVRAPSMARHMSYQEADALCQRLRADGYQGPVVVDIYARVVDVDALDAERKAQDQKLRRFWGDGQAAASEQAEDSLPTTHKELYQLSATEYRRRMSDPAFEVRVNELEAQPREAAKARR